MCGIFAAVSQSNITEKLLRGLDALAYRGYDSAGIAVSRDNQIERRRASGKLKNLENLLTKFPADGFAGIGHTRWATHGIPNEFNAHPHMTPKVAIVHNGIIENYAELRRELTDKRYHFESETDSEVIAQLLSYHLDTGLSPMAALTTALQQLQGSYGIAIMFADLKQQIFVARAGNPLVIGQGDQAVFVSSDENALVAHASALLYLQDGDIAHIRSDNISIYDLHGNAVQRDLSDINREAMQSSKAGFDTFMRKEIAEQPEVVSRICQNYIDPDSGRIRLPLSAQAPERLQIVACGTSYFSGLVSRYWFESLAGTLTDVDIASEYRYRQRPACPQSTAMFISQSGETADTLAALQYAKDANCPTLSLVNVVHSSMAQLSDSTVPLLAGQEIGVASTKAFSAQLTVLLLSAAQIARQKGHLDASGEQQLVRALWALPAQMQQVIHNSQALEAIAEQWRDNEHMLYLGRGIAYPIAEEGALKLKEISYIHAEAYPAGELKHGPLALVDEQMPVVIIAPPNSLFGKTVSNLREVAARGGKILLLSNQQGLDQAAEFIEHGIALPEVDDLLVPLLYTLPLQLFAYHLARARGHDVDQPRNLAKSVTVE